MEAPLSQREFDTWREEDTAFKVEMRSFMAIQNDVNLDVERRVTSVETNYQRLEQRAITRTGIVSSIVAAVIGALGGLFASSR